LRLLIISFFFFFSLYAKEYTAFAEHTADSKKSACDRALAYAKEEAMAQAGTYVSSEFSVDFKDTNGSIDSKKSRELKQYSLGLTKLLSKKSEVIIDDKTYQFTCKVRATFDVDVDKIKDHYQQQTPQPTTPLIIDNSELKIELYKLKQQVSKLQKQLDTKQDDTQKIAILHGKIGIDSEYGDISGTRLTFGLVLKDDLILKFGSGANKAIINQTYNTFEILDFSATDNNSIYSYFYHTFGVEYYAFRHKDYFLTIAGNLQFSNKEQLRENRYVSLDSYPQDIDGNIGFFLGFSYYKFGLVFTPSSKIQYTKDNNTAQHKSSILRFGLSLIIPIDLY
jgi:hypothetical protein